MELVTTAQQTSTFYTNSSSLDSGKLNFNDPDLNSVLISSSRVGNEKHGCPAEFHQCGIQKRQIQRINMLIHGRDRAQMSVSF